MPERSQNSDITHSAWSQAEFALALTLVPPKHTYAVITPCIPWLVNILSIERAIFFIELRLRRVGLEDRPGAIRRNCHADPR